MWYNLFGAFINRPRMKHDMTTFNSFVTEAIETNGDFDMMQLVLAKLIVAAMYDRQIVEAATKILNEK